MLIYLHYEPDISLSRSLWAFSEFSVVPVYLCLRSPVYLEEDEALEEAIQRSLLEDCDGPVVNILK